MQITKRQLSDTKIELDITLDDKALQEAKTAVLKHMAADVRLSGFRPGKAPLNLVERNVNQGTLQAEFIDRAVNDAYTEVLKTEKLHPVEQPKLDIKKFVPFDTLQFTLTVEVVGKITLADYKKIKLARKSVTVSDTDVDEVIANLRMRSAEKKDVDRAAKDKDQVWIDFVGVDKKTKEPVNGADGKNYPLVLGSNTFIPGFEPSLIGLKAGDKKAFDVTFPKDYGVTALRDRAVSFTVNVLKVQQVIEPKLDKEFAAKVGPFKTVAELKSDIKKQLLAEKQHRADQEYADELLRKLTDKSKVAIPKILIEEQIDRFIADKKQNVIYRGQTWQEFLDAEGLNEDKYRDSVRTDAELRVKAGVVLAEIAEREKISISSQELEARLQALKQQYASDSQMMNELDKPEARRTIASRLATEKTITVLTDYSTAA